MNESGYWKNYVKDALQGLDPVRIEGASSGTPDVNYADGWIELKYINSWPKKDLLVRVNHFTVKQRLWLRKRWTVGKVYLLLGVGQESLLFNGIVAAEFVGRSTQEVLLSRCALHAMNKTELQNLLKDWL